MLIDQAPERKRATVVTEFLGQPARVDLAPALMALRARVPLVAVFARRCPDGSCVAELGPVIVPPARPSRRWAEQSMIELTRALEAFVRQNPDQWLWMHRRWKDASDDAVLALLADEPGGRRAA
jgi:KDO2-lipid IV(A) lauroyltransferase